MTKKNVSLTQEAYEKLKALKKESESFSQLILRLIAKKEKQDIKDFAGAFEENSEEWEKIEKELYERRKEKSRHC